MIPVEYVVYPVVAAGAAVTAGFLGYAYRELKVERRIDGIRPGAAWFGKVRDDTRIVVAHYQDPYYAAALELPIKESEEFCNNFTTDGTHLKADVADRLRRSMKRFTRAARQRDRLASYEAISDYYLTLAEAHPEWSRRKADPLPFPADELVEAAGALSRGKTDPALSVLNRTIQCPLHDPLVTYMTNCVGEILLSAKQREAPFSADELYAFYARAGGHLADFARAIRENDKRHAIRSFEALMGEQRSLLANV